MLVANLPEQTSDCFQVAAASGTLGAGQRSGENSRVNCSSAGFECVRRGLDSLGVTALHRLIENSEASRRIFYERGEQGADHFFHTRFAQLRAEALEIYV